MGRQCCSLRLSHAGEQDFSENMSAVSINNMVVCLLDSPPDPPPLCSFSIIMLYLPLVVSGGEGGCARNGEKSLERKDGQRKSARIRRQWEPTPPIDGGLRAPCPWRCRYGERDSILDEQRHFLEFPRTPAAAAAMQLHIQKLPVSDYVVIDSATQINYFQTWEQRASRCHYRDLFRLRHCTGPPVSVPDANMRGKSHIGI